MMNIMIMEDGTMSIRCNCESQVRHAERWSSKNKEWLCPTHGLCAMSWGIER